MVTTSHFISLVDILSSIDRNMNKNIGKRKIKVLAYFIWRPIFQHLYPVREILRSITRDAKTWEKATKNISGKNV